MPSRIKPAFAALWALDCAFADVVSTSTDARLGMIRLAWWRDRLDELYVDIPVPEEPRLQAADEHLWEYTNGAVLSEIPSAWMALLEPFPWGDDVAEAVSRRGEDLFWVGARILGCGEADEAPLAEGRLWSLVDVANHCSDAASRELLLAKAHVVLTELPRKAPRKYRPLSVLGALAAADLLHDGRGRAMAALVHRLTGRFPTP